MCIPTVGKGLRERKMGECRICGGPAPRKKDICRDCIERGRVKDHV